MKTLINYTRVIYFPSVTSFACVRIDHHQWNSIVALVFLFVVLFVFLVLVMMMVLLLLVVSMDRHMNDFFHGVWDLFVDREFNLFVDWIVFFNGNFHFVWNWFLHGVRDLFLHTEVRRKIKRFFFYFSVCSRIMRKNNLLVWLRHGYFHMNWNYGRQRIRKMV